MKIFDYGNQYLIGNRIFFCKYTINYTHEVVIHKLTGFPHSFVSALQVKPSYIMFSRQMVERKNIFNPDFFFLLNAIQYCLMTFGNINYMLNIHISIFFLKV